LVSHSLYVTYELTNGNFLSSMDAAKLVHYLAKRVIAKLLAGRDKDLAFADALVRVRLIDPGVLAAQIETVQAHPVAIQRARSWIASRQA